MCKWSAAGILAQGQDDNSGHAGRHRAVAQLTRAEPSKALEGIHAASEASPTRSCRPPDVKVGSPSDRNPRWS